jgi:hypothetical protein
MLSKPTHERKKKNLWDVPFEIRHGFGLIVFDSLDLFIIYFDHLNE